jgi:hypothetical protein
MSYRIAIAIPVAIVIMLVLFVIRNPDFLHRFSGPEFKVGDCVHVEQRLTDSSMSRTECKANSVSNTSNPIYRVDQVKDGKDASCPGGFNRVTFSNEPEDTTYCLTMMGF